VGLQSHEGQRRCEEVYLPFLDWHLTTLKMGLALMRIAPSSSNSGSTCSQDTGGDDGNSDPVQTPAVKIWYTKSYLSVLFPRGPDQQFYISTQWPKYYVPYLLSWAGAQEDPFGTSACVEGDAVLESIWKRVYTELVTLLWAEYGQTLAMSTTR